MLEFLSPFRYIPTLNLLLIYYKPYTQQQQLNPIANTGYLHGILAELRSIVMFTHLRR